ncbi:MAG: glycosyltransferase family 2 protein [Sphingobacterium sp.]|jgi:glycosyltransferase involved in cell wall biosynthesis|nr:glycosyltransferase family 2 protein [Sphingobacterium sp.]
MVSIITPCFNAEKFISQTIESVLKQTYVNWELIIVNDCSTDGSKKIIESYKSNDSRIILLENAINQGVAVSRNIAMDSARGEYLAFLDADDQWDSNKLELQLLYMKKNNYYFSYCNYRIVNEEKKVLSSSLPLVRKKLSYTDLLKGNDIGCLTVMINVEKLGKKKFLKIGHEDFAFWLSYLKNGTEAHLVEDVLASYRVHSQSVSHDKIKAAKFTWNIYRNIENFSVIKSLFYFLQYGTKSFFKHLKIKLKNV